MTSHYFDNPAYSGELTISDYYVVELQCHINRNHEKEFQCDVCEETFSKRHEREHHIDLAHRKISRCQICGNEFDSAKNLQIHLHFFHEGWEYHTCKECNSIYTRPNDFFSHLNDAHVHKEQDSKRVVFQNM